MGIATVAVHSTADADAMHVRLADESVCIGPPPARDSYLNIPASSPPARSPAPTPSIPATASCPRTPASPRSSRRTASPSSAPRRSTSASWATRSRPSAPPSALGIPVVPGSRRRHRRRRRGAADRRRHRLPGAGQGGRRRRRARHEGGARPRTTSPRRSRPPRAEAKAAFGDDAVYLEKYLGAAAPHRDPGARRRPRQRASISASATARCSAATRRSGRRRPRPPSTPSSATGSATTVAEAMRKLSYRGAGTIEFLYEDGEFYFIEMNTRLQVEHPVTEAITGIDLVQRADPHRRRARRCRFSAGRRAASTATPSSAASMPRTRETFAPSPGTITYYHPPGGLGVRVDSGRLPGLLASRPIYDSLIGKLIVHGRNRNECLMRLRGAFESSWSTASRPPSRCFRSSSQEPDIERRLRYPLAGEFLQKP